MKNRVRFDDQYGQVRTDFSVTLTDIARHLGDSQREEFLSLVNSVAESKVNELVWQIAEKIRKYDIVEEMVQELQKYSR